MQGRKTGGRQAGTPNKRSAAVEEKLENLGCDPLAEMASLAMDADTPVAIRARLLAELAGYVAAKRKAVELTSAEDFVPPQIVVTWVDPKDMDAAANADIVHVKTGVPRN